MPVVIKPIKFDLPIDGIKAKNLEELRDHFTLEILAHYRSGLLGRWLASRKLQEQLTAIQALADADDLTLLKGLCAAFAIDIDDEIATALLNEAPQKHGSTVNELRLPAASAHITDKSEVVDLTDFLPIKADEVKVFERCLVGIDQGTLPIDGTLILKACQLVAPVKRQHRWLDCYSDLGNGTILDNNTGLQWMRCALGQTWDGQTCTGAANTFNWEAAKKAAADSRFAGYHDWRLPTIDELKTLIVAENKPTIDHRAFPNTPANWLWSGSPGAHLAADYNIWKAFGSGYADYSNRYSNNHVRLVRVGQ